ncbi:hypothetical protein LTR16_001597 [Cryomyces antarcticus]|uniref:3-oxoacyl-[acyl-carrier-protein] reductase n=1 Tax=Cryomyces antarcticus TaxID=329879 RepID=A0ABR0KUX1_9PEZI|nr:hypothetical protein LTR39_001983 [Cryomyces antarcticus]KAK5018151.1 hypothetical protein LTR60_001622 [Cryomyces antarcticus]KAK5130334.1 hypothetical protein LTR16_001597 [Cryomyces antarcticus]
MQSDVDVLVNAAGITNSSLLMRADLDKLEEVIQTNLVGTILASRSLAKRMLAKRKCDRPAVTENESLDPTFKDRRGGCIINVSSLLGVSGGKGAAAYAASKAGVLGLTRALAAELGPAGIRVNAIVPGYIDTDMTSGMSLETRQKLTDSIPLKRFGAPEEVAEAAVFLATNEYASNCIINLDGGLSATVCFTS